MKIKIRLKIYKIKSELENFVKENKEPYTRTNHVEIIRELEEEKPQSYKPQRWWNICKDLTEQLNIKKEELERCKAQYQKCSKINILTDQEKRNSNVKLTYNSVTRSTMDQGAINKMGSNYVNGKSNTKQDETSKNDQMRTQVKRRNIQKVK